MEKVRVDTEVRKLDQLRAGHRNQQHQIKRQLSSLPNEITREREALGKYTADVILRDQTADADWSMTVGKTVFSGEDARKKAADAIVQVVMSWRGDESRKVRAVYRGFDILSQGYDARATDRLPELYVRGAAVYSANLNAENPVGTLWKKWVDAKY